MVRLIFSHTRLLVAASSCLLFHNSHAQVQSTAGYSQQVLPSELTGNITAPLVNAATLKQQYTEADHRKSVRTSNVGNDRVRKYGVLTDGDFTKAVGKDAAAPTTGSIGLNYASFLPVTYGTRYFIAPLGSTDPTQEVLWEPEPELLEPWLSINLLFSLGSRGDTLVVKPDAQNPNRPLNQRDFGQSLLLPGSNASTNLRSVTISGRWRPATWWVKHKWFRAVTIGADLSAATTRWGYPNKRMSEFTMISSGIRANYTLFDTPAKNDDDFAMQVDAFAGLSGRLLRGDIREDAALLTQALGTENQFGFGGYDLGVQASVNALRLTATYSTFGSHIKGFSGGQFIFNVGFSSAFRFSKTIRS